MEILKQQISLFGEKKLMSLPVGSLANLLATQGDGLVVRMNDIYIARCLERYQRLNQDSSWQRMFILSLHVNLRNYSNLYIHRWKTKGTKFNRLLFLLQRSRVNTKDIGFGLLPTPMASDFRDRGTYWDACNQRRLEIGKQVGLSTLFKKTPCPSCVIHMMGYPEDYLSKPFMQQETQ